MIAEVHGAGFQNKGAELMLRAVLHELTNRVPDFEGAVDPLMGPYKRRAQAGLLQVIPPRYYRGIRSMRVFFLLQRVGSRLVPAWTRRYGCVRAHETGALLDLSGFAFSDQWGGMAIRNARRLGQIASWYRRRGKPVILMPQAFGPFESKDVRDAFRRLSENVDLMIARDGRSFAMAKEVADRSVRLLQAPDCALFFAQREPLSASEADQQIAVVPNCRMLDKGTSPSELYVDRLCEVARYAAQEGYKILVVVHSDEEGDRALAQRILSAIPPGMGTIEVPRDSETSIQTLRRSLVVVGSRYHALVASLANHVPAICLGWSHKYNELYGDLGVKDLVLNPEDADGLSAVLAGLLNREANNQLRGRVHEALSMLRPAHEAMWDEVTDMITGSTRRDSAVSMAIRGRKG